MEFLVEGLGETRSQDFVFHVFRANVYAAIIGVALVVALLLLLMSRRQIGAYPRIFLQCFATFLRQHEWPRIGNNDPWAVLVSTILC